MKTVAEENSGIRDGSPINTSWCVGACQSITMNAPEGKANGILNYVGRTVSPSA